MTNVQNALTERGKLNSHGFLHAFLNASSSQKLCL